MFRPAPRLQAPPGEILPLKADNGPTRSHGDASAAAIRPVMGKAAARSPAAVKSLGDPGGALDHADATAGGTAIRCAAEAFTGLGAQIADLDARLGRYERR